MIHFRALGGLEFFSGGLGVLVFRVLGFWGCGFLGFRVEV